MGVKGLWSLLNPVARPVQLESMEGKRLAIDSSIWLYQFQATMRDKDGRVLVNAHVLGFLRRINKLLFHGIKPVFVFDGGAPVLKRNTIAERKKKKAGAAQNHAKLAEKLFAAQMRREAVKAAQAAEESRAARAAVGNYEDLIGDEVPENATYLDELEGRPGPSTETMTSRPHQQQRSKTLVQPEQTEAEKRRKKFRKHDPYRLPETTMPTVSTEERPDARLATEAELQQFIDEMHPEDIDVESAEFRALPTEIQYEIIGDLRIRSRQQSHKRLADMLRAAPTALDFSRAQIKGVSQRNALTQQLLTVTDMVGSAHLTIPVRIAAERNREYVLVKKGEEEGGGWALGIREGTKEKPIKIDHDDDDEIKRVNQGGDLSGDESEGEDDESDFEMVEGKNPKIAVVDEDLRAHRRQEVLQALMSRYVPQPTKSSRSVAIKPFGATRQPVSNPLFDTAAENDDEGEYDKFEMVGDSIGALQGQGLTDVRPTAHDEALALAIQQEELGSDEDEVDLDLARALAWSRQGDGSRVTSVTGSLSENGEVKEDVEQEESESEESMEEVSLIPSTRTTPVPDTFPESVVDSDDEDDEFEEVVFDSMKAREFPKSHELVQKDIVEVDDSDEVGPEVKNVEVRDFNIPKAKSAPTVKSQPLLSNPELPVSMVTNPAAAPRATHPTTRIPRPIRPSSPTIDHVVKSQVRPPPRPSPLRSFVSVENIPVEAQKKIPKESIASQENEMIVKENMNGASNADDEHLEAEQVESQRAQEPDTLPSTELEESKNVGAFNDSSMNTSEEPLVAQADLATENEDNDNDDSHSIEWSRSPSPIGRSRDRSPSLHRTESAASLASELETDGEMAPEDAAAEEDDYARFMAQIKNRDLNAVRTEIDDEIRVLNAQTKVALRDSDEITQAMIGQIQALLRHFGIPYITAPMEAEAQCAKLAELGLVDGIITDDSDVFLFGGTRCFKNIFNDAKYAECFLSSDIERELSLNRERLISLAYLLGSDYTIGLPGVGPVVALELLANFPGQRGIQKFKEWWLKVQRGQDLPIEADTKWKKSFKKRYAGSIYLTADWPNPLVREAYLYPTTDESDEPFHWGFPRLTALRSFLHEELSWSISKVDDELKPIIQRIAQRGRAGALNIQSTLDPFFDRSLGSSTYAPRNRRRATANVSKRLMAVIKEFREAEARVQGVVGEVEWGEMMSGVDESDSKERLKKAGKEKEEKNEREEDGKVMIVEGGGSIMGEVEKQKKKARKRRNGVDEGGEEVGQVTALQTVKKKRRGTESSMEPSEVASVASTPTSGSIGGNGKRGKAAVNRVVE